MCYLFNLTRVALDDERVVRSPSDRVLQEVGFLTDDEREILRIFES